MLVKLGDDNLKCSICGVTNKKITLSKIGLLCSKHYRQFMEYGKVLDNNPRTAFDYNNIILKDDHALIEIYNRKQEIIAHCIIDLEDIEKCKNRKWRNFNGYVATNGSKTLFIHRMLMLNDKQLRSPKIIVDHKDGNPLNNRKSNLRITTQQNNVLNRSFMSNNTSGILGVCFDKELKEYVLNKTNK